MLRRQAGGALDQLDQEGAILADGAWVHFIDLGQGRQVVRLVLGHWPQRVFLEDTVARHIAAACFTLAPGAQLAEHRQLLAAQLPGQLDIAVQGLGLDLTAQRRHQFGTVFQHPGVLVVGQPGAQGRKQFGQVHGILGGVADLGVRQRALQPVRAGFTLGQLKAQHFLDQARIAHGEAQVQVARGQLRVEQRLGQLAGQAQQHFEVFAAGVQHLDHAGIL
ncbi:hypothetical protein D3C79_776700 [compost metagenome]